MIYTNIADSYYIHLLFNNQLKRKTTFVSVKCDCVNDRSNKNDVNSQSGCIKSDVSDGLPVL